MRLYLERFCPRGVWWATGLLGLAGSLYLRYGSAHPETTGKDALLFTFGLVFAGGVAKWMAPRSARLILLALLCSYLGVGVGLAGTLAVILWLVSAWGIGRSALCWACSADEGHIAGPAESILLGTAFWLAVWGAMLHFPVNVEGLHLGLCLLSLAFTVMPRWRGLCAEVGGRARSLQSWAEAIPFWFWVAGLTLIGWVLRWAIFPSLNFDDQTLHLRLWTELLHRQQAAFDVHEQVWSVAPFANDLLHAGLSMISGEDARGALNLTLVILLLALCTGIWQRLAVPATAQWLLLVMIASTPMLGSLLLSLQTELLLAVLGLAGMTLVIDARSGWRDCRMLGILACAALCAATKLPGAVLGAAVLAAQLLPLGRTSLAVRRRTCFSWRALALLGMLTFVALHAYGLAWRTTGNPVFPLYNAIFRSPLFPLENFSDSRWIHGFSLLSYVRGFFNTSEFFESGDLTAGFQYLLLLPIVVFVVWRPTVPFSLRIVLLPLAAFGLAMFSATQYWRYLFPAMSLASVLFASLFIGGPRWLLLGAWTLALACIVLNISFFTRVSWMMQTPVQAVFTEAGRQRAARHYAPEALLTAEINRIAPGSRVLYPPTAPFGATLHGQPLYVNWYAPERSSRFAEVRDQPAMREFLSDERVDFVILNQSDSRAEGTPSALLREYLARTGIVLRQEGSSVLYRVSDVSLPYLEVFNLADGLYSRPDDPGVPPAANENGVVATAEPHVLARLSVQRAAQARYTLRLRCLSDEGYFIAQINWDVGPPYYRLVACREDGVSFREALPVPLGARHGELYVTVRGMAQSKVEELKVEVR